MYYATSVKAGIYWRGVCFFTVLVWHFVKGSILNRICALVSCRKATDSYLWRIPEMVCVMERTHLVKYRSNIWHNLFNNEACQKALNLRNRKCSLAPTKLKTVRIKHMDRQWKWHTLKTVSSRCLGFYAKIVCKGIMNGHF